MCVRVNTCVCVCVTEKMARWKTYGTFEERIFLISYMIRHVICITL